MNEMVREHNDRGTAIIGATIIERVFESVLSTHFRQLGSDDYDRIFYGDRAPLGTLSAKSRIAYALNLCTKQVREETDRIREIRNAFAHALRPLDFETQEICNLCAHLRLAPEAANEGISGFPHSRLTFIGSIFEIVHRVAPTLPEQKSKLLAQVLLRKDTP